MTIYNIEIDGKYYKIVDIRKSFLNSDELKICGGEKTYIPLVIALLQRITEKQLKAISKNNIIIMYGLELKLTKYNYNYIFILFYKKVKHSKTLFKYILPFI